MKREIKFRAKVNGNWIVSNGFIKHPDGTITIITKENIDNVETSPIEEGTLCEFTGIKHKNKNDVFEGDILKSLHFIDAKGEKLFLYHRVEWCERLTGWLAINMLNRTGDEVNGNPQLWCYVKDEFEIIGNIHDHKDLLEANQNLNTVN